MLPWQAAMCQALGDGDLQLLCVMVCCGTAWDLAFLLEEALAVECYRLGDARALNWEMLEL